MTISSVFILSMEVIRDVIVLLLSAWNRGVYDLPKWLATLPSPPPENNAFCVSACNSRLWGKK